MTARASPSNPPTGRRLWGHHDDQSASVKTEAANRAIPPSVRALSAPESPSQESAPLGDAGVSEGIAELVGRPDFVAAALANRLHYPLRRPSPRGENGVCRSRLLPLGSLPECGPELAPCPERTGIQSRDRPTAPSSPRRTEFTRSTVGHGAGKASQGDPSPSTPA